MTTNSEPISISVPTPAETLRVAVARAEEDLKKAKVVEGGA